MQRDLILPLFALIYFYNGPHAGIVEGIYYKHLLRNIYGELNIRFPNNNNILYNCANEIFSDDINNRKDISEQEYNQFKKSVMEKYKVSDISKNIYFSEEEIIDERNLHLKMIGICRKM